MTGEQHENYDRCDNRFQHLLGKKVQAIYKGRLVAGELWFAGINEVHGQFQLTLGRGPFWPIDPNTVTEYVG